MKIKYKNEKTYLESHISTLSDLNHLNLQRGCITFLIPLSDSKEAVKQVNNNVVNQNIKMKATDDAVELICNYADILSLERDLMDYRMDLEPYIDDVAFDKEINSKLRCQMMCLDLYIEGSISNLLL